MTRVAVLDDIHDALRDLAPIKRLAERTELIVFTHSLSVEERPEALPGVEPEHDAGAGGGGWRYRDEHRGCHAQLRRRLRSFGAERRHTRPRRRPLAGDDAAARLLH